MSISNSSLERLCNYILQNADNNPNHEMHIKPSDYGYALNMKGTTECKNDLQGSGKFSLVSIEATNLLRIRPKG